MLDAVLRVFGDDFNVGTFLQKYPMSVQVEPFLKGEPDILGNPNSESGFDAIISENQNPIENLKEIQAFLLNNQTMLEELKSLEIYSIMDIACCVNTEQDASPSILLVPDFLNLCAKLNVSIEFSTYHQD